MKALLFTDFHAHLFQEFSKPDPKYYTDRFKQQCEVLETMLKRASREKRIVIFGGDLFHKRGAVDVRVFNKIYNLFSNYCATIPAIYLLRGNHDSYDNSMGSVSSLDTFSTLKNTCVISKPMVINTNFKIAGKPLVFSFMPYGEDIDAMKQKLEEMSHTDNHNYNMLVAHLGIDGARQGRSVHRLASAFSLSDMYPDSFDKVYLGHYHARQFLADNVWYGGSTMQLSFNDEGETKGYDLIEDDGSSSFVEVKAPKFITLTEWNDKSREIAKDNYIRLQVPKNVAQLVTESKDAPSTVRVEAQSNSKVNLRVKISADDSPVKIVNTYMDKYYPEQKSLANEIIKVALDDKV